MPSRYPSPRVLAERVLFSLVVVDGGVVDLALDEASRVVLVVREGNGVAAAVIVTVGVESADLLALVSAARGPVGLGILLLLRLPRLGVATAAAVILVGVVRRPLRGSASAV